MMIATIKSRRLDVILEGVDVGMDTQVQREEADEDDERDPRRRVHALLGGSLARVGDGDVGDAWLTRGGRHLDGGALPKSCCLVKVGKTPRTTA